MENRKRRLALAKRNERRVPNRSPAHHPHELFLSLFYTVPIVAVDNKDETLRVLKVVPPQRPDLVLATDIPNRE
jgi:hypothetical protein